MNLSVNESSNSTGDSAKRGESTSHAVGELGEWWIDGSDGDGWRQGRRRVTGCRRGERRQERTLVVRIERLSEGE